MVINRVENLMARLFDSNLNHGGDIALIETDEWVQQQGPELKYSYAQLRQRVLTIAGWLQAQGVKEQSLVAVHLPRSFELIATLLAIYYLRGVYVPLAMNLPPQALAKRLAQANASMVVAAKYNPAFESVKLLLSGIEDQPASQASGGAFEVDEQRLQAFTPEHLLCVLFTSGSTGEPKGVMITQQGLTNQMNWKAETYPIGDKAVQLHRSPLNFDVSLREVFQWLAQGGTLVLLPEGKEADPQSICQLIGAFKPVELSIVPCLLDALLSYVVAFEQQSRLSCLTRVLVGGEVLSVNTVNKFKQLMAPYDTRLINLYGPTEATIDICHYDCTDKVFSATDQVPIGKPSFASSLSIVNKSTVNHIGELVVSGEQVAMGYLNAGAASQRKFITQADGQRCYYTGDLVSVDSQGCFYFHGREDDQVKVNGIRIELQEVQQAFEPLLDSTKVCVTLEKSPRGQHICAYIVAEAIGQLTQAQIMTHLSEQLEKPKLPQQLSAIAAFPLTASCKVDRGRLAKQVVAWHGGGAMGIAKHIYDQDQPNRLLSIVEAFEITVEHDPGRLAVSADEWQLSYAVLNQQVNRVAHALIEQWQLDQGDIVAVMLANSASWLITVLAILKAGGAYLPIGVDEPSARVDHILDDAKVELLIGAAPMQRPVGCDWVSFEQLLAATTVETNPAVSRSADSLAVVIYTSGSTGLPKGVMLEDQGLHYRLQGKQQRTPLAQEQATLLMTAVSFDVSMWEAFGWIYAGGAVVIAAAARRNDPGQICEYVAKHGVGELNFTPSHLHSFLVYIEQQQLSSQLRHVRWVRAIGEILKADTVALFNHLLFQPYGVLLYNHYGPAEASIDVSQVLVSKTEAIERISIGVPHQEVAMYILDSDGQLCRPGEVGQIAIAGVGLARGYLNKPALTQSRFVTSVAGAYGRVYLTGDLGYINELGEFEFVGREDQQVKIHGHRIELAEVEQGFSRLIPSNAVVVGTEQMGRDLKLVAWVVESALAKAGLTLASLTEQLQQFIPLYMVPSVINLLAQIPLNANGKVDRQALKAVVCVDEDQAMITKHQDQNIQVLRQIVATEFGLAQLPELAQNLSEYGLDSINVIHLVSEIKRQLGWSLRLEQVYGQMSIAQLLACKPQQDSKADLLLDLNPLQQPTLYCFPPASGFGFAYQSLADELKDYRLVAFHFPESVEDVVAEYVDYILKHSDSQPLKFIGYSGGGNLALAVAQQLAVVGRAVELVILVDSFRHLRVFEQLPPAVEKLQQQMIDRTMSELADQGLAPERIRTRVKAYYQHHWTTRAVIDQPLACKLVALFSDQQDWVAVLELCEQTRGIFDLDWGGVTGGEYCAVQGHGPHHQMLSPPFVQFNGAVIRSHLDNEQL